MVFRFRNENSDMELGTIGLAFSDGVNSVQIIIPPFRALAVRAGLAIRMNENILLSNTHRTYDFDVLHMFRARNVMNKEGNVVRMLNQHPYTLTSSYMR